MRKPIYFTSDWHIGHENALVYDQRPFKDLGEMHKALIKNFNQYVPNHGVTYFLGDMGLCSHGLLKSVIDQLNGTKVLVRGNHDGNFNSMYAAGFDVVTDKAQICIGKNIVTMTHCPLKGVYREDTSGMRGSVDGENWHKESKHGDRFSIEDFGQFHLHGHIHANPRVNSKPVILDRQYDVGVMGNNYKPVSFSQIESFINLYNKEKK